MHVPFAELTFGDGRHLDIPPLTIVFVEGLDPEAKKSNPGCRSGLFYDLGESDPRTGMPLPPRAAVVQEPFAKIVKMVRSASPAPRIEVDTAFKAKALLEVARVVSLQDLAADHPNGAKCQITHRIGARLLPLDVLQTRDEIRALMGATPTMERADDGDNSEE